MVRDCLVSLREHAPRTPLQVFVVDNDSREGTIEMIQDSFPEITLHASSENLGFSKANNLAIREGGGDYVLALNPDTRITAGALDRLLELMEEREVGICGCRLELEDGSLDHAAKRSFPTPLSALGHFTGLGRREGARGRLAAYRAPDLEAGRVDAVNGAFMLMRRRMLDEVGLFDEAYWMYMEDLDLCYRAAQAGWVTWYEPNVSIVHIKAGTSGKNRALRLNYAFHYGMYRFYRKHYAQKNPKPLNWLIYAGIGLKLSVSAVRSAALRARSRFAPQKT